MSWIWTILGGLLIAFVAATCIVFFFVRPALAKKVQAGAAGLAKELHGQPPLMSGPASCQGITDVDRLNIKGIGAIGLTSQALVFVAGSDGAALIIPRASVQRASVQDTLHVLGRNVRSRQPMLVVQYTNSQEITQSVGLVTGDPQVWANALSSASASVDGVS